MIKVVPDSRVFKYCDNHRCKYLPIFSQGSPIFEGTPIPFLAIKYLPNLPFLRVHYFHFLPYFPVFMLFI